MENLDIVMARPDRAAIPAAPLAPGYSIRWYRDGDEAAWGAIQQAADRYTDVTPALFREQFGTDDETLAARMAFVCGEDGAAIGTAAAWYDTERGGNWGRVHWVAIVPERQGLGLAKPLMTAVLHRMAALGHDRAYLTTSTARIPAIHLYLNYGFVPEAETAADRAAWGLVAGALAHPALSAYR